jgi:hypothetical protein
MEEIVGGNNIEAKGRSSLACAMASLGPYCICDQPSSEDDGKKSSHITKAKAAFTKSETEHFVRSVIICQNSLLP